MCVGKQLLLTLFSSKHGHCSGVASTGCGQRLVARAGASPQYREDRPRAARRRRAAQAAARPPRPVACRRRRRATRLSRTRAHGGCGSPWSPIDRHAQTVVPPECTHQPRYGRASGSSALQPPRPRRAAGLLRRSPLRRGTPPRPAPRASTRRAAPGGGVRRIPLRGRAWLHEAVCTRLSLTHE